ncbi:hypothetical protein ACRRTK_022114 [Alexandromys fortis]
MEMSAEKGNRGEKEDKGQLQRKKIKEMQKGEVPSFKAVPHPAPFSKRLPVRGQGDEWDSRGEPRRGKRKTREWLNGSLNVALGGSRPKPRGAEEGHSQATDKGETQRKSKWAKEEKKEEEEEEKKEEEEKEEEERRRRRRKEKKTVL